MHSNIQDPMPVGAARVISTFGEGRVDLDRAMDIQAHACLSSSHAVAALAADSASSPSGAKLLDFGLAKPASSLVDLTVITVTNAKPQEPSRDHRRNSRGSHRFVSGLAENTNSIFCADSSESQTVNGCPVLRRAGTTSRETQLRNGGYLIRPIAPSPKPAQKSCALLLTKT